MLVQKLDNENDELRGKLAAANEQVSRLNVNLKEEKEQANRGPTAAAKEHMNRLKQQIQEKDEELQVSVINLQHGIGVTNSHHHVGVNNYDIKADI